MELLANIIINYLISSPFQILWIAIILFTPIFAKKILNKNELIGLVTTLGILGTFAGIVWGLLNFDVTNIYGSVPQLLEGLKTAFFTSIAGMIGGIIIKLFPRVYGIKQKADERELTAVESMAFSLKRIEETQNESLEYQKQSAEENKLHLNRLQAIEKALIGEGDTTLLTQMQKLRTSFSDKMDDLVREFREFAKTMAENNSKALIDALTEVMRDFNAKINEQFGDNFKRLNEAVFKMVEWQDKYKEQMEMMMEKLDIAVNLMDNSSQSISRIENSLGVINDLQQRLEGILRTLDEDIETFATLAEKAENALPNLENAIAELTEGFTQRVNNALDETRETIEMQKQSIAEQIVQIKKMNEQVRADIAQMNTEIHNDIQMNIKEVGAVMSENIDDIGSQINNEIKQAFDATQKLLDKQRAHLDNHAQVINEVNNNTLKTIKEANDEVKNRLADFISKNEDRIIKHLELIDKALQDELTKSLQTLARQMASLSEKFAADYTPITNGLQKILQAVDTRTLNNNNGNRTGGY